MGFYFVFYEVIFKVIIDDIFGCRLYGNNFDLYFFISVRFFGWGFSKIK